MREYKIKFTNPLALANQSNHARHQMALSLIHSLSKIIKSKTSELIEVC